MTDSLASRHHLIEEMRRSVVWGLLHHHQIFVRDESGGCYLGHTRQAEARQTRHSFHLQLVSCRSGLASQGTLALSLSLNALLFTSEDVVTDK